MISIREATALTRTMASLSAETVRGRWLSRGTTSDERFRAQARAQYQCAIRFCRASRIRVEVTTPLPDVPGLIVGNHLGAWDGFALAATHPMAIAAKEEVDGYPIVGAMTRTFGVLLVPRGRPTEAGGFVDRVQARLRADVPVLVFPEGTTGDGVDLLPFKTGAFEAVADTRWPVLPVAHLPVAWGKRDTPVDAAMMDRFAWQDGQPTAAHMADLAAHLPITIRVAAGTPISSEGKNRKQLAREAQAAIAELVEGLRP